jgi:hypothetical protein
MILPSASPCSKPARSGKSSSLYSIFEYYTLFRHGLLGPTYPSPTLESLRRTENDEIIIPPTSSLNFPLSIGLPCLSLSHAHSHWLCVFPLCVPCVSQRIHVYGKGHQDDGKAKPLGDGRIWALHICIQKFHHYRFSLTIPTIAMSWVSGVLS